jgi:plasmid stabilization system protein ParE
MRRVEWAGSAEWDLQAIDDYWCTYGTERADEILEAIRRAGDFLAGLPEAGPTLEGREARKWRVAGTYYVLIYRLVPDGIQVLRVQHAREDWRP